jgi:hypothetical protein
VSSAKENDKRKLVRPSIHDLKMNKKASTKRWKVLDPEKKRGTEI